MKKGVIQKERDKLKTDKKIKERVKSETERTWDRMNKIRKRVREGGKRGKGGKKT